MAPCNQQHRSMDSAMDVRITSSDPGSVAPVRKIAKKKKRVRLDRPTANGKLHVDFKVVKPIVPKGRNAKKFCREVCIVFKRHAPLIVRKWDDIPKEQIQQLIDRVLSKFEVDISQPYDKGWMLWRMRMEHRKARREDAKIKELMSMFASSSIGSFDMDHCT